MTSHVRLSQLRQEGMTQQDVSTACAKDANLSRTVATVLSLPLQVTRLEGDALGSCVIQSSLFFCTVDVTKANPAECVFSLCKRRKPVSDCGNCAFPAIASD